jgi:hypothetical protein
VRDRRRRVAHPLADDRREAEELAKGLSSASEHQEKRTNKCTYTHTHTNHGKLGRAGLDLDGPPPHAFLITRKYSPAHAHAHHRRNPSFGASSSPCYVRGIRPLPHAVRPRTLCLSLTHTRYHTMCCNVYTCTVSDYFSTRIVSGMASWHHRFLLLPFPRFAPRPSSVERHDRCAHCHATRTALLRALAGACRPQSRRARNACARL